MPFGDALILDLAVEDEISLPRCPHCFVANPALQRLGQAITAIPGRPSMYGRNVGRLQCPFTFVARVRV